MLPAAMLAGLAILTGCLPPGMPDQITTASDSHRLLVGLTAQASPAQRFKGVQAQALLPERHVYQLSLPNAASAAAWLQRLQQQADVRFAETDQSWQLPELRPEPALPDLQAGFSLQNIPPNDPEYALQWNLQLIDMEAAWARRSEAPEVTVAVIDSGVDPEHPDLAPHLLPLEDVWGELGGEDILVARRAGLRFDYRGRDGNGHGTHVAGIIAAVSNNAEGIAGIAGGGVRLLPIKVTNLTGTTNSRLLIEALRRAIAQKADVINMSIGTLNPEFGGVPRALREAIELAQAEGIVVVAASGNESDRRNREVLGVTLPAAYPGVIAVGAATAEGTVANYSNGGPELDLLAPGGEGNIRFGGQPVLSTWTSYPSFEYLQGRVRTLSYAYTTGTSMAAPHVSAVAALLKAQEPDLSPAQIRARLIATATPPEGKNDDKGYGLLNAARALQFTDHDALF
ncbi:MAG: S8 family serine peptidase [Candidatus Sericytochromatia bacterium]|nr:S8 family serine peptidase [Candidatus Sericytochromatia bacterium]